jgi:hypothetical protein
MGDAAGGLNREGAACAISTPAVIPAKAGIRGSGKVAMKSRAPDTMDPGLCRADERWAIVIPAQAGIHNR